MIGIMLDGYNTSKRSVCVKQKSFRHRLGKREHQNGIFRKMRLEPGFILHTYMALTILKAGKVKIESFEIKRLPFVSQVCLVAFFLSGSL